MSDVQEILRQLEPHSPAWVAKLRAEIARLTAALEPFAIEAAFMLAEEDGWPHDEPLMSGGTITLQHYRNAAEALRHNEQEALPESKE